MRKAIFLNFTVYQEYRRQNCHTTLRTPLEDRKIVPQLVSFKCLQIVDEASVGWMPTIEGDTDNKDEKEAAEKEERNKEIGREEEGESEEESQEDLVWIQGRWNGTGTKEV